MDGWEGIGKSRKLKTFQSNLRKLKFKAPKLFR